MMSLLKKKNTNYMKPKFHFWWLKGFNYIVIRSCKSFSVTSNFVKRGGFSHCSWWELFLQRGTSCCPNKCPFYDSKLLQKREPRKSIEDMTTDLVHVISMTDRIWWVRSQIISIKSCLSIVHHLLSRIIGSSDSPIYDS